MFLLFLFSLKIFVARCSFEFEFGYILLCANKLTQEPPHQKKTQKYVPALNNQQTVKKPKSILVSYIFSSLLQKWMHIFKLLIDFNISFSTFLKLSEIHC